MAQAMAQGSGIQFGDRRFNQGIQRPNSQAFTNMLANLTPEDRSNLNGLPQEKLNDLMRRFNGGQEPIAMNGAQMMQGQMACHNLVYPEQRVSHSKWQ
ncbi:hypothetical protein ESCO_000162 [Escovopsis weberi]|uniref:Uncharacterized protein n=1 Tax=Escovopsis weberi TaxID=150374 RepID=A0A0M8MTW7_ESCWE|nr:hypothetical protein ESCO_000162 [Escovopsis weberi]